MSTPVAETISQPQSNRTSSKKSQRLCSKKILVVEDDHGLREALEDTLQLANYMVISAKHAEQAVDILSHQKDIQMVVSDINMGAMSGHELLHHITHYYSHIPVLLMTAYGSIKDSVDAIRQGAIDYLVKPFEPKELVDIVHRQLSESTVGYEETPIVADEYSQQLLALAKKVAQSDSTALILGESGTGKEVLARYVHQQSSRAEKPFVAINCAAIPENMLEAMLFGYEKGAYTGAYNSAPGKFEQANGGTLLLDEISEMDINLQAKLLRVLQEKEVERLGGRKMIKLDVRVIATSNRDMLEQVRDRKFREDLYYRLSVLPLVWKPLRERTKDILPLAEQLLSKHTRKQKRPSLCFSDDAKAHLIHYPWPGNVRELDNVIQRALILQSGCHIYAKDLGLSEQGNNIINPLAQQSLYTSQKENVVSTHGVTSNHNALPDMLAETTKQEKNNDDVISREDVETKQQDIIGSYHPLVNDPKQLGDNLQQREFEIIAQTLQEEQGSRKNTAKRLGISPRTLRYKLAKMRELGLLIDKKVRLI